MEKLTFIQLLEIINCLEKQIEWEINRLEQSRLIDLKKEWKSFRIYEKITKKILENNKPHHV